VRSAACLLPVAAATAAPTTIIADASISTRVNFSLKNKLANIAFVTIVNDATGATTYYIIVLHT
jgi:hypothetical protein